MTLRHHPHRNLFAPQPAPALFRTIAYSFVGITVLIAIMALWLSSTRARATVKMKREITTVDTFVDLAKNPEAGQLRGRIVKGTFQQIQDYSVKEGTPVDGIVVGVVTIINAYSKPQTLVATTRLLTADNRLYRIDKTVVVPSKQSVTVTAHADKPGRTSEAAVGTKLTIPGLWPELQKFITAEVTSGFSSTKIVKKIASENELKDAYASLQNTVMAQAEKALRAEAGVGTEWNVLLDAKIIEKKSNVTVGEKTESFLASMKIEVTGVFYPAKDIEVLIRQKLKEKLPDERELIEFDPSRATTAIDSLDVKNEKARLHITAQALSRLTEKSPQLAKSHILGLSEADASAKLKAVDGVERVDIRIRPSWIHTIPSSASHLELVVQ
ncbi:MAG: hypothetical protein AAB879_03590 [Patescibacteria group bacterium]